MLYQLTIDKNPTLIIATGGSKVVAYYLQLIIERLGIDGIICEVIEPRDYFYKTNRNQFSNLIAISTSGNTNGIKDVIFTVRKINGLEVSREQTGEEISLEPTPRTLEVGTITTGDKFIGKMTSYGADCIGCGTRTAAGLYVTTTGVKNEPTATLSFNGGEYYVLAADKQFPFGTIIKVSNHSYNIPDPFYGIVLDRGGLIKGTKLDLYTGSQKNPLFGGHGGTVNYEIIAYGDGRTSIY